MIKEKSQKSALCLLACKDKVWENCKDRILEQGVTLQACAKSPRPIHGSPQIINKTNIDLVFNDVIMGQ